MQVHITSPSYLKIDPGFPSLRMLKLPPNPVQTSVLEQTRPGLVKAKGNIVFRTLIPQGEHPGIIANTRFGTRLAADRYLFDFRSEIRGQIYGTYQRGANDNLVTNRQLLENRQPIIGHPLILHRATDRHMLVPCTPVPGQTLGQPVDTLGKKHKMQVPPQTDHLPCLTAPDIGLGKQKVRCKTGKHHLPGRNFPPAVPTSAHGEAEGRRFHNVPAVLLPGSILAINITLPATFAHTLTPVPRIPRYGPMNHTSGSSQTRIPGQILIRTTSVCNSPAPNRPAAANDRSRNNNNPKNRGFVTRLFPPRPLTRIAANRVSCHSPKKIGPTTSVPPSP